MSKKLILLTNLKNLHYNQVKNRLATEREMKTLTALHDRISKLKNNMSKALLLLSIISISCSYTQSDPEPVCDKPSVQCSNGEYYNGRTCPKKMTIIKSFDCDTIIYKRR